LENGFRIAGLECRDLVAQPALWDPSFRALDERNELCPKGHLGKDQLGDELLVEDSGSEFRDDPGA
jgi:hypothetical protein